MNETILQKLAKPMLLAAPIIWGTSFVVMKHSLDSFTPLYLLAFRFTAAALVLGLVFWKSWRHLDRGYLMGGLATGTLLFWAYAFQTFGLEGTTSGKNAFLTAVYCVIVPFLNWAVSRKRPDGWNVLAAVACVAGIGLVSLSGEGGNLTMGLGDALTLVCGFFFAAHIVVVNRYAQGRDIFLLTTLQFAFFALWSWVGAVLFREPFPTDLSGGALFGLAYLVIFASCGGLLFQNIGQKYTAPATAAVLLSLEAPFGVLSSILVGEEELNPAMVVGFGLIFLAVICSETKFAFLRPKKGVDNPAPDAYNDTQANTLQTCDEEK